MAYDYKKLLGKIVEMYGTQYLFAEALGISEHSLSMKLNNKLNFKQKEISSCCELLNIPEREVSEYFFKHQVQKFEQSVGRNYNE